MRTRPAARCSGATTGMAAIVVQLGFAIIPLRAVRAADAFTSATTSGTSGSIRHADELSITVTAAAANRGACTRDIEAPAENSARSNPAGSAASASSTTISVPSQGKVESADREDVKYRTSTTGNAR